MPSLTILLERTGTRPAMEETVRIGFLVPELAEPFVHVGTVIQILEGRTLVATATVERMNRSAMPELLDVDSTPADFTYPRQLVRAVELGITNLELWWILTGSELRERAAGLAQRYPALTEVLVPFAWRQDNDDIACCDATGEIVTVHDFATPDWAVRGPRYPDFGEWLKQAVQDHLDFGC